MNIKNTILSLSIATILVFTLSSGITNGNMAPYGKTGSPGDGSNCTHCHTGTAIQKNFVTANIPNDGYIPGQTYTVTIAATQASVNKFGFELTCENASGAKVGTFVITNSTETRLIQDEVTHTGLGTAGSNNQKTWTVDWIAPASGTGSVTFYSAVNAANGNGGTSGDIIILSNYTYVENVSSGLSDSKSLDGTIIFPTQVDHTLHIRAKSNVKALKIVDINGKIILKKEYLKGMKEHQLQLNSISKGMYFIQIQMDQQQYQTLKFYKK